jgi:Transposase DDE domain group 1
MRRTSCGAAEYSTGSAIFRKQSPRSSSPSLPCPSQANRRSLAYNLANFLRTLATPEPMSDWSLTTLKEKLIKIGAKVVSHGRYIVFQMAEVAIPRQMIQEILRLG